MARQSPHRPEADEPDTKLDEIDGPGDAEDVNAAIHADPNDAASDDGSASAAPDRALWEEVRIDPVEIALPIGVGFTLRAYRLSTELTPTDISARDEDDPFAKRAAQAKAEEEDDDTVVILDEDLAAQFADDNKKPSRRGEADGDDAEPARADEEEASEEAEEVPIFLSHEGRLLLFKNPESLVSFARSGAPHDLAQLDTWQQLVERIQPADIAPLDEDSYELDLVVENLRGGHDSWEPALLIEAGEAARDLAYALRLSSVLDMLSAGSSLDDLDEALRSTAGGGLGAFLGRRRLKKIGAQTASLGWRTIIGKISAAVDWRD